MKFLPGHVLETGQRLALRHDRLRREELELWLRGVAQGQGFRIIGY